MLQKYIFPPCIHTLHANLFQWKKIHAIFVTHKHNAFLYE